MDNKKARIEGNKLQFEIPVLYLQLRIGKRGVIAERKLGFLLVPGIFGGNLFISAPFLSSPPSFHFHPSCRAREEENSEEESGHKSLGHFHFGYKGGWGERGETVCLRRRRRERRTEEGNKGSAAFGSVGQETQSGRRETEVRPRKKGGEKSYTVYGERAGGKVALKRVPLPPG